MISVKSWMCLLSDCVSSVELSRVWVAFYLCRKWTSMLIDERLERRGVVTETGPTWSDVCPE